MFVPASGTTSVLPWLAEMLWRWRLRATDAIREWSSAEEEGGSVMVICGTRAETLPQLLSTDLLDKITSYDSTNRVQRVLSPHSWLSSAGHSIADDHKACKWQQIQLFSLLIA